MGVQELRFTNVKDDMAWPFKTIVLKTLSQVNVRALNQLKEIDQEYLDDDHECDCVVGADNIKVWNVGEICEWTRVYGSSSTDHIVDDMDIALESALNGVAFAHIKDICNKRNVYDRCHHQAPAPTGQKIDMGDVSVWGCDADGALSQTSIIGVKNDIYFYNTGKGDCKRSVHARMRSDQRRASRMEVSCGWQTVVSSAQKKFRSLRKATLSMTASFTRIASKEIWPKLAEQITTFRRGMHYGFASGVTADELSKMTPCATTKNMPDNLALEVDDGGVLVWNLNKKTKALNINTIFMVKSTPKILSQPQRATRLEDADGKLYRRLHNH